MSQTYDDWNENMNMFESAREQASGTQQQPQEDAAQAQLLQQAQAAQAQLQQAQAELVQTQAAQAQAQQQAQARQQQAQEQVQAARAQSQQAWQPQAQSQQPQQAWQPQSAQAQQPQTAQAQQVQQVKAQQVQLQQAQVQQQAQQAQQAQVQQSQAQQAQQVQQVQVQQQAQQAQQAQAAAQRNAQQPVPPGSSGGQAWQYQATAPQGAYAQAYQVPQTSVEPKKGKGWIVAIVVIVCLFAFSAFCVKSCTDALGFANLSSVSSLPSGDTVAILDIDGTIQYDGTACSPEGLKELLDEASDNDNIKALVLRVNSGGGTATAGEEMATYVKDFSKPVVVSSASINASAAYEISSQADYIYVAKSTEIGAIGTAMQVSDISGLLDMLGVDIDVITSAESKDSSYGFRPLTDEEREYYQRMVDQINSTFVQAVAEGRNMTLEQAKALATGLPFTGLDAIENGLADAVGTREDAIAKAAELAGITDYDTYDLQFSSYDLSSLYDLLGSQQGSGSRYDELLDHLKNTLAD